MKNETHASKLNKLGRNWHGRAVHTGNYNPSGDSYGYIQTKISAVDIVGAPNVREEFPRLISLLAAAPELLAALEAIVANPDMADGEEPRRLIAAARAAIAKAKGQQ